MFELPILHFVSRIRVDGILEVIRKNDCICFIGNVFSPACVPTRAGVPVPVRIPDAACAFACGFFFFLKALSTKY